MVRSPEDIEARSQVMLGSLLAGIAFNSAILGLAHIDRILRDKSLFQIEKWLHL